MGDAGPPPSAPDLNGEQADEIPHPPLINMNRLRGR